LGLGVDTSYAVSGSKQSEWVSPNEEIFAVSYVSLKFEGSGLLGRGPKKPVIGDVVLANNRHAALSAGVRAHSDDDESGGDVDADSDIDSDVDSDVDGEQVNDSPMGEVVVLTDEELVVEGIDHFVEVPIGF
jgi:hypothetical protein